MQISAALGRYKVPKNLPGQRIGAKTWYEHLRSYLAEELNFEFDVVNPCLGKRGDGHDLVCILIHVDDVMFTGRQKPVKSFVMKLKEKFEIDVTMVKEYGQEFSFLKRKYVYVEDGLLIKPGQYASIIIKTYEDHFGPARKQKLPATSGIQDADGSNLASPEDAAIYRSIVGMGIYLAQERMDVAFVVKELAGRMSSATEISLLKAQKFVGYLKETEHQIMKVAKYLNRLMMVSGLELAAGKTTDMVMIEPNYKIPFYRRTTTSATLERPRENLK